MRGVGLRVIQIDIRMSRFFSIFIYPGKGGIQPPPASLTDLTYDGYAGLGQPNLT